MNIQAIWENGAFRPIEPIVIKHASGASQLIVHGFLAR